MISDLGTDSQFGFISIYYFHNLFKLGWIYCFLGQNGTEYAKYYANYKVCFKLVTLLDYDYLYSIRL